MLQLLLLLCGGGWGELAVWGEDAEEVIHKEADNEVVSQVAWEWLQVEPEILPSNKKEH